MCSCLPLKCKDNEALEYAAKSEESRVHWLLCMYELKAIVLAKKSCIRRALPQWSAAIRWSSPFMPRDEEEAGERGAVLNTAAHSSLTLTAKRFVKIRGRFKHLEHCFCCYNCSSIHMNAHTVSLPLLSTGGEVVVAVTKLRKWQSLNKVFYTLNPIFKNKARSLCLSYLLCN